MSGTALIAGATVFALTLEGAHTLAWEPYAAHRGTRSVRTPVDGLGRLRPSPRALSTSPCGPCAHGAEQTTAGRVGPSRIAQTGRGVALRAWAR